MILKMESEQDVSETTDVLKGVLIASLFIVSLFFPTSKLAVISTSFELLVYGPLLFFLVLLLWRQPTYNTFNLITGSIIISSLLLFTLIGSFMFNQISIGALPGYVCIAMVSLLNLNDSAYTGRILRITLLIVSIAQIILGIGIVTRDETIRYFLIDNYSSGYDTLVPFMIDDLKPVTTFASHSVAGFFFFIIFLLNLQAFRITRKVIYLFVSVLLILLLIFIRSNTAYLYSAIAFVFMIVSLGNRPGYLIFFLGISFGVITYVYIEHKDLIELLLEYDLQRVTGHQGSGLAGRYTEGSYLSVTIDFIARYPFFPIGLCYSDDLFFTDSGVVVYFLRGSVFLLFSIYVGFYHFLKRNLKWGSYVVLGLFGIYFIFELGYPNLINPRTVGCIPFVIYFLNHLKAYSKSHES
jgi:hypothetical protein